MNRKNAKSKKKKASGVLLAAVMTVNAGLLAALTAVVLGGESAQIMRKSDMTAYEANYKIYDITPGNSQIQMTQTPEQDSDEFLRLVNWDNPIYEEPEVVYVTSLLTAANVECDSRRHINETAGKALNEMMLAAHQEGEYKFIIASAFRHIYEQEMLWNRRASKEPNYGSDPYNKPVAVMPKNNSEHTTGLAVDILCEECPRSSEEFANTAEGRWLHANAHRFGFVLRYGADKQGITGVRYEPWHFRYVGIEHAKYMYEHNLCLEEYAELLDTIG